MSRIRWSAATMGFVLALLAYGVSHMAIAPLLFSVTDTTTTFLALGFLLTSLLRLALGAVIALLALRGGRTEVAPVLTAAVAVGANSLLNSAWLYTIGPADLGALGALGMTLYDLAAWSGTAAMGAWMVARSRRGPAFP